MSLSPEKIQEAWYVDQRQKRRPLWARVVLTYSFGWFFAGEVVGILLSALVLVLVKAI